MDKASVDDLPSSRKKLCHFTICKKRFPRPVLGDILTLVHSPNKNFEWTGLRR